jgi:hypothetical protein
MPILRLNTKSVSISSLVTVTSYQNYSSSKMLSFLCALATSLSVLTKRVLPDLGDLSFGCKNSLMLYLNGISNEVENSTSMSCTASYHCVLGHNAVVAILLAPQTQVIFKVNRNI